jgi:hypothetical protein
MESVGDFNGFSAGLCDGAATGTRLWFDNGPFIFSQMPLPLCCSVDLAGHGAGRH